MNYIKYLFLLFPMTTTCEKIIRNINIPSCKKCIYFIPAPYNFDFTSNFNKCAKFGEKDIVTDKINHDFAELCRQDETNCGKEGKYFEEEENLHMKIFVHKTIYFFTITSPLSIMIILYLCLVSYVKK